MDRDALSREQLWLSLADWLKTAKGMSFLSRLTGPGQPLSLEVQRRMEALLGRDLSEVRIHDTRQAGEIAENFGAEAFAVGPQIFSAPDELAADRPKGLALLAHELTHVVQQTQPTGIAYNYPGMPAQPAVSASSSFVTGQGTGLTYQPAKAPIQVQLAAEAGAAEPDTMEAQALAVEQAVQEAGNDGLVRPATVDPHEIADRVYRLMQEELRLERERKTFPQR